MAKLFLHTILTLVLLSASQVFASSFGNVDFSGNTRYTTSGSDNTGSVKDNVDLNLRVTDCDLSIEKNQDLKGDEQNSNLDCSGNSRCQFKGRNNRVEARDNVDLKTDNANSVLVLLHTQVGNIRAERNCDLYCSGNTRFEFRGENDKVDARNNVDVRATSRSSNLILDKNQVLNIRVDNARLNANGNTRLTVTGSEFEADVSNTVDHTINRPRQSSNTRENSLKISRGNGVGIKKRDTQSSHHIVSLEIVDKIVINGSSYKIGEIEFTLEPVDSESVKVNFSNETLTKWFLKKRFVNNDEVVVTSVKNGKKQHLRFLRMKGDKIASGNGKAINVLLLPN